MTDFEALLQEYTELVRLDGKHSVGATNLRTRLLSAYREAAVELDRLRDERDGLLQQRDALQHEIATRPSADARDALLRQCGAILQAAPGLPIESAPEAEQAKWTDAVMSLCVLLNDYMDDAALDSAMGRK